MSKNSGKKGLEGDFLVKTPIVMFEKVERISFIELEDGTFMIL